MADLNLTLEHRAARNQATIDLADRGSSNSRICMYDAPGAGRVLLATVLLAKPCGTLNASGQIVLQQDASEQLATGDGQPTWGEWEDGDGAMVASGAVTISTGSGPFTLAGAAPGTTQVYAGAVITLGESILG